MTITFHHPPTGTNNPFKDFQPANPKHYPKGAGAYIYGVKLNIGGKEKFIALYVGKHNSNVGKRVFEHYYQERMPGNSCKEIFDLTNLRTNQDIIELYTSIKAYDSERGKTKGRLGNKNLIWFNDRDFFNSYFTSKSGTIVDSSDYLSGSGHLPSLYPDIGDLDMIAKKNNSLKKLVAELKSRIITTKLIILLMLMIII